MSLAYLRELRAALEAAAPGMECVVVLGSLPYTAQRINECLVGWLALPNTSHGSQAVVHPLPTVPVCGPAGEPPATRSQPPDPLSVYLQTHLPDGWPYVCDPRTVRFAGVARASYSDLCMVLVLVNRKRVHAAWQWSRAVAWEAPLKRLYQSTVDVAWGLPPPLVAPGRPGPPPTLSALMHRERHPARALLPNAGATHVLPGQLYFTGLLTLRADELARAGRAHKCSLRGGLVLGPSGSGKFGSLVGLMAARRRSPALPASLLRPRGTLVVVNTSAAARRLGQLRARLPTVVEATTLEGLRSLTWAAVCQADAVLTTYELLDDRQYMRLVSRWTGMAALWPGRLKRALGTVGRGTGRRPRDARAHARALRFLATSGATGASDRSAPLRPVTVGGMLAAHRTYARIGGKWPAAMREPVLHLLRWARVVFVDLSGWSEWPFMADAQWGTDSESGEGVGGWIRELSLWNLVAVQDPAPHARAPNLQHADIHAWYARHAFVTSGAAAVPVASCVHQELSLPGTAEQLRRRLQGLRGLPAPGTQACEQDVYLPTRNVVVVPTAGELPLFLLVAQELTQLRQLCQLVGGGGERGEEVEVEEVNEEEEEEEEDDDEDEEYQELEEEEEDALFGLEEEEQEEEQEEEEGEEGGGDAEEDWLAEVVGQEVVIRQWQLQVQQAPASPAAGGSGSASSGASATAVMAAHVRSQRANAARFLSAATVDQCCPVCQDEVGRVCMSCGHMLCADCMHGCLQETARACPLCMAAFEEGTSVLFAVGDGGGGDGGVPVAAKWLLAVAEEAWAADAHFAVLVSEELGRLAVWCREAAGWEVVTWPALGHAPAGLPQKGAVLLLPEEVVFQGAQLWTAPPPRVELAVLRDITPTMAAGCRTTFGPGVVLRSAAYGPGECAAGG